MLKQMPSKHSPRRSSRGDADGVKRGAGEFGDIWDRFAARRFASNRAWAFPLLLRRVDLSNETGTITLHVEFENDELADAFQREFISSQ
jgi:hypothetical protein